MNITIFGNGGELAVDGLGNVYGYDPSEEVTAGDHDGYGDIVRVDLNEWLRFYDLDGSQLPSSIDILDIDYTLDTGEVIKAEPTWRAMAKEQLA